MPYLDSQGLTWVESKFQLLPCFLTTIILSRYNFSAKQNDLSVSCITSGQSILFTLYPALQLLYPAVNQIINNFPCSYLDYCSLCLICLDSTQSAPKSDGGIKSNLCLPARQTHEMSHYWDSWRYIAWPCTWSHGRFCSRETRLKAR